MLSAPLFSIGITSLVILALIPQSYQQNYCTPPIYWEFACFCKPDGIECLVCGSEPSIVNLYCQAYNDTYEDSKLGTTPGDSLTQWTNFTVDQWGPNNPIYPSSENHMIRSLTGTGELAFTTGDSWLGSNLGGLYSFDYACADPAYNANGSRSAVACNLTVGLGCPAFEPYAPYYFEDNQSVTLAYDPASKDLSPGDGKYPGMAAAGPSWTSAVMPPLPSGDNEILDACNNFTFMATQAGGKAAILYLDNVVYNTWTA